MKGEVMSQIINIEDPEQIQQTYPEFIFQEIQLNKDEYIVKASRKHWIVFRSAFLVGFFIPFVTIFMAMFISTPFLHMPKLIADKLSIGFMYASPIFFFFGVFMFLWELFLWYRTFYLVTSQRLIKVEQQTLFSSKTHQMYLDKVQDAICKISGFEALLYGYGDISIQGSSETAQLEFKKVGYPKKMQKIIASVAGKVVRTNQD